MLHVLVVSAEPRLIQAIESNFDDDAQIRVVRDAGAAQSELFETSFALVLIDYEAVKGAPLEAFVTIDNVLLKERTTGVLLVRSASREAEELRDRLDSIPTVIDLSKGRPQFDDKIRLFFSKARDRERAPVDDPSISTDRIVRHEVDLPALDEGNLVEFPLARVLYTIRQRKESGTLTLRYASHVLKFGFVNGELAMSDDFEPPSELLGAFAWSHGQYAFEPGKVDAPTTSVIQLISDGCRDHVRQRGITEVMTPIMRRYPVPTNLWEERKSQLENYEILHAVMAEIDGATNWEKVLSALGQQVTDGFRAAYFANMLDMVHTLEQPGFEGAAVQYSREVRRARAKVDQAEVEKTKAYQAASGAGRSKLERELGSRLSQMRDMTPHEIFGVWEGCGRKVVQDKFYVLVKENHPDVYGGNTSGNVRSLAQDIFILIKNSYQKLLAAEKQQTVPPPDQIAADDEARQSPGRTRKDTPRLDATRRTSSSGGQADAEEDRNVDVKSKLAQLSGFRKRQKHRKRMRSRMGSAAGDDQGDEKQRVNTPEPQRPVSEPEPEPEPEPAPEELEKAERQAKLDHLLKRAQSVANPDGPNPAKEFWNKGFHALKEGNNQEAYQHFEKAYELEPEDGPILTFYAYTKFLTHEGVAAECEKLLRDALQTGNRQSAPDACLYLGHTLKAQGKTDEALKYYERTLRLNPASHEAQREIRLAESRDKSRKNSDPGNFIKNLFKK